MKSHFSILFVLLFTCLKIQAQNYTLKLVKDSGDVKPFEISYTYNTHKKNEKLSSDFVKFIDTNLRESIEYGDYFAADVVTTEGKLKGKYSLILFENSPVSWYIFNENNNIIQTVDENLTLTESVRENIRGFYHKKSWDADYFYPQGISLGKTKYYFLTMFIEKPRSDDNYFTTYFIFDKDGKYLYSMEQYLGKKRTIETDHLYFLFPEIK